MNALLHRTTTALAHGALMLTLMGGAAGHGLAAEPAAGPDPFARPNLTPSATAETSTVPTAPPVAWRPALRAIVLAGNLSMVKVGSSVVELGEEIDGYRLIRVTEEKAVFAKGRRRVELTIGGDRGTTP